MKIDLSRFQIALLVWVVACLAFAEYLRYRAVFEQTRTRIGLVEVAVAILTGLALGVSILRRSGKAWSGGPSK